MSRSNLSPNYCSCTVIRARDLLDKGKIGGTNAFCTISLGKEKFVTGICEKTTSPVWQTQCDLPITDGDTPIKLTVYTNSKNSLSEGDLIGRVLVSLRDLPDYDRVHTNWYKLVDKKGKADKDRGEIEVSLQFYSKNNDTGSVLDLATKKKHVSLKDIKHSLSDKLKSAAKHNKASRHSVDNQLSTQRNRLGTISGSSQLGGDPDDSPSESTSFTGSFMSVNSMSNNNNADQQKKKSRAPTAVTPRVSQRSTTSDYETSSILDSASMYGGDESSISSSAAAAARPPIPPQREVNVDEHITSKKKSKKDSAPIIIKTKPIESISPTKDLEANSQSDSFFGLSTIRESHDSGSKNQTDDEIDCEQYFAQKKSKKLAPVPPTPKEPNRLTLSPTKEIKTPSTSASIRSNPLSTASTTQQSESMHDSTDEDVDELLGNLERMSSMRSSVKRRVQPRDDIISQSFAETEMQARRGSNQAPANRSRKNTLPDVIVEQRGTDSPKNPTKSTSKGLHVLGYDNVKITPVNPTVRQELEYIDREDLLHIIAHQSAIIKKRDTRLKDLEQYTDGLLVKIVEQCPAILQNGPIKFTDK